jgi:hypothetical protein
MTLAVVWFDNDRLYAAADTRIIREAGNVLTEHGPKLMAVNAVCKAPGPSGFFDKVSFFNAMGFVYAGATLPALCTVALSETLFQNLLAPEGTPPPQLSDFAGALAPIARHYMREIGELSGPTALFEATLFGFCAATGRFKSV